MLDGVGIRGQELGLPFFDSFAFLQHFSKSIKFSETVVLSMLTLNPGSLESLHGVQTLLYFRQIKRLKSACFSYDIPRLTAAVVK